MIGSSLPINQNGTSDLPVHPCQEFMKGHIDIVVNLFTPEEVRNGQTGFDSNFSSQVRMPDMMKSGVCIDDYLKKMDRAGIERSLLIAVRAGDLHMKGSFEIPYAQVAQWCERYPDRFLGAGRRGSFPRHAGTARSRTGGA